MWRHNLKNKQLQYTYCPISQEVDNQTTKFGQLMEYKTRNIFLEKSYTKCEFMQIVFVVCQVEDYQKILKLSCRALAFTSDKAFLKIKKWYGTSLPQTFSV